MEGGRKGLSVSDRIPLTDNKRNPLTFPYATPRVISVKREDQQTDKITFANLLP